MDGSASKNPELAAKDGGESCKPEGLRAGGAPPLLNGVLLGDTHLGFDLPQKARVEKRRRGEDFFTNLERVLGEAVEHRVDFVVHAGDLFNRSQPPAFVVDRAARLLFEAAEQGLPIVVVPGNHERSRLPAHLLFKHPNLHIFDRPRSFPLTLKDTRVTFLGFPFFRGDVRRNFRRLLREAGHVCAPPGVRLLCVHHAIEGAVVGTHDFTFRRGREDVVTGQDLPYGFAATLSGHIHRAQTLERDLSGAALPCPVLYAGAVERTSFVERFEDKGYVRLALEPTRDGGRLVESRFVSLHPRPMIDLELSVSGLSAETLNHRLVDLLEELHPETVLRVRPVGVPTASARALLSSSVLRSLAPSTMSVELPFRPMA